MFGGIEAVAFAIEWATAELIRSPGELKHVQEELTQAVGLTCKVEEPNLDNLIYLHCCLRKFFASTL